MSILASLVRAYDRLPDAPPYGYTEQSIQFMLEIDKHGRPSIDSLVSFGYDKKRLVDRELVVPYFGGRSGSAAPPYFLWDNSAYVLGRSAKENFDADKRHAAFKELHLNALAGAVSPVLQAVRLFLENWNPEEFDSLGFTPDSLDRNIVFRLNDERRFAHESLEAAEIWQRIYLPDALDEAVCLVTGEKGPIARIHPPLKTFDNPARIVSFDKDNNAFSSYDHVQAENAPVGSIAAFKYTAVLNRFLKHGNGHRIQIGDASTVFWADAGDGGQAAMAEDLFNAFFDRSRENTDDKTEATDEETKAAKQIAAHLGLIRQGRPLDQVEPRLAQGVQFNVLGLAPNAARLSVRFWWQGDFGRLTAHYQRFVEDMRIDPPPREGWPPLWRYLLRLLPPGTEDLRKLFENKWLSQLAGDWMRAILSGAPYPLTLMSSVLIRLRTDGQIDALRAAILKSVLIRNFAREVPVALDPAYTDKGYVLGRLFAVYEEIQRGALGNNVNATIKDKFYGAASASPQKVYRTLDSGAKNHLSKLQKVSFGRAVNLEKLLISIVDLMAPQDDPIPASLSAAEQALFGIGYYHQRSEFFRKKDAATNSETKQ